MSIVDRFLAYAEKNIRLNYMKERGTTVFEGVAFSQLINDYIVEVNKINQQVSNVTQLVRPRSMRDHDWFIYDNAIVNGLESKMLDFVIDYVDSLREKYDEVYLIRNERKVKVVEFDGVRGFMPDFLLYLKDKEYTYQVFLEPKGENLIEKDKWKEDFLLSLSTREDIEILSENENVRLIGIKFFSDDSGIKQEFRKDFSQKVLGKELESEE